ncbi:MAG: hypothetical protein LQ349_008291 [Xanthoria aureola]|nr:MAG: hypothetical protein LQ349_008291 [Xanthoria aureola]
MPIFSRKSPSISNNHDNFEDGTETAPLAQDTDAMQRFTATGRPKPSYNPSALGNLPSAFTHQAPQFLPQRFTDDSVLLIPIPVSALRAANTPSPPPSSVSENPTTEEETTQQPQQRRLSSSSSSKLMNRLRGGKKKKKKEEFKMVEMTRGEYLRYWAKDEEGRYIGTEPEGEGVRRLRERDGGGGGDLSK